MKQRQKTRLYNTQKQTTMGQGTQNESKITDNAKNIQNKCDLWIAQPKNYLEKWFQSRDADSCANQIREMSSPGPLAQRSDTRRRFQKEAWHCGSVGKWEEKKQNWMISSDWWKSCFGRVFECVRQIAKTKQAKMLENKSKHKILNRKD